jgi:predicted N-acyltransferase
MTYSCKWYTSIDEVNPVEWDCLLESDGDFFMDRRYIRAVERSMSDSTRFWYVVIRDTNHQPVVITCLHAWNLDLRLFVDGWRKAALGLARRVVPRAGRRKILCCGLPISAGRSGLRIAAKAVTGELISALDDTLQQIAGQERASSIILRDLTADESDCLLPLGNLGYLRGEYYPVNFVSAPYRNFDDFYSHLNRRKRKNIRLSREKFAQSGLRVVHLRGSESVERLSWSEVHGLFLQVAEKKKRTYEIPSEFFRELALQLPEETVFTLIYDGARIVAFVTSVCATGWCDGLFLGYDHELNRDYDLYFNLLFHFLDYALRQDVTEISLGQGGDTFKRQKFAAYRQPRYMYFKAVGGLGSAVAPYVIKKLFPIDRERTSGTSKNASNTSGRFDSAVPGQLGYTY